VPLTMPNHRLIKGSTLRLVLRQWRADFSQGKGGSQSQWGERISTHGSPSRRLATASFRVRRSTV
jgi:hypothetical protein